MVEVRRRRRRRRGEEGGGGGDGADIKSNNPHLTGGEKVTFQIKISEVLRSFRKETNHLVQPPRYEPFNAWPNMHFFPFVGIPLQGLFERRKEPMPPKRIQKGNYVNKCKQ